MAAMILLIDNGTEYYWINAMLSQWYCTDRIMQHIADADPSDNIFSVF